MDCRGVRDRVGSAKDVLSDKIRRFGTQSGLGQECVSPPMPFELELSVGYEDVVRNSQSTNDVEVVLDHRPLARWSGEAPEPRPGEPSLSLRF